MKKLTLRLITAFTFISLSTLSYAAIISSNDVHTTGDGSVVNLSGLDWLSWDQTVGMNRFEVEEFTTLISQDGWRYATVQEYSDLMTSVYNSHDSINPSPEQSRWNGYDSNEALAVDYINNPWGTRSYSYDNRFGADWLYNNLYNINEDEYDFPNNETYGQQNTQSTAFSNFSLNNAAFYNYFGGDDECGTSDETCRAHYRFFQHEGDVHNIPFGTRMQGGWSNAAENSGSTTTFTFFDEYSSYATSVLVRASAVVESPTNDVSEPSIIALFGFGFLGFGFLRRQQKNNFSKT